MKRPKRARLGWTIDSRRGGKQWVARAWDAVRKRYQSKSFSNYEEGVAWAKQRAQLLGSDNGAMLLACERAPWETLVAIAQAICNRYYPESVFTGASGDPGPRLVVALRKVITAREPEAP